MDASARVRGESVSYWMENSPLGDMAGTEAQKLQYRGQYQLDLGIDLPLGSDQLPVVEASIDVEEGAVSYPAAGLEWQSVRGALTYHSEDGFSGGPLAAEFFGEPVTIAFSKARAGNALSIRQSGSLRVPEVFAKAGLSTDSGFGLQGNVAYSAELDVGAQSTSGIRVRSSLEGLSVDWPEPLSKTASEAAPLRATINPSASGGLGITGDWENRATFDLLWKETVINWDGCILPCCSVYSETHSFGNIKEDSFKNIWNNQKYIAARKEVLGRNNNTRTVCHVCKANGYLYI